MQAPEWYREDLVGQAVIASGIPREELFLTSKLHPRHHAYDVAMIQFTKSISALAVEYVDLFLLHYPACWAELCGAGAAPAGRWQDSWKALETLVDKGLIRAIGKTSSQPQNGLHCLPPSLMTMRRGKSVVCCSAAWCNASGRQRRGNKLPW